MWQMMLCTGIAALILEIFVPSFFFLNFAAAGFICTILAYYVHSFSTMMIIFCVLSLLLLLILRPILLKLQCNIKQRTGMEEKYIGKTAVAASDIDKTKGIVSIYDERWQAKNIDDDKILAGSNVKITGYDSIVLLVKKL